MTKRERLREFVAGGKWITFWTRLLLICSAITGLYYTLALPPFRWVAVNIYRAAVTPVLAEVRVADAHLLADVRVADSIEAATRARGDDSVLVAVRGLRVEIQALNTSLQELERPH